MMAASLNLPSSATLGGSLSLTTFQCNSHLLPTVKLRLNQQIRSKFPTITCCSEPTISAVSSSLDSEESSEESSEELSDTSGKKKRRTRYRKQYPGEKQGITEEMRFVAMKLHNTKSKINSSNGESVDDEDEDSDEKSGDDDGETWEPSIEGFLKYLVDSKLVFDTIERIVEESRDVSYAYFRKTGLERSRGISKDIDIFREQGLAIPEPSNPGIIYAKYLEELGEKSPPLFLSHFYNIYFSHIAGGQVIAKKVSEKLLEGREMELYSWDGDESELLKGVREKLNMIAERWPREEKSKCLREATKAFRYLGQIVRLIILF
jgi:heme oxygenase